MIRCALSVFAFLFASTLFAERISLVENGAPKACIVLPPDAGPILDKAATELVLYVKKLVGVELPIRSASDGMTSPSFVLGDPKAPLPPVIPPREQHALESFSVRVSGGNVYFGGHSPEAITYGVLAFIEDTLGVRWFGPGDLWEYMPPHVNGDLTIDVSSRVVTPDTPLRILSTSGIPSTWERWIWHNRGKSLTKRIRGDFSTNRVYKMFPANKYAKSHPEYYPLIRGKRVIPPSGRLGRDDIFWPCVSNAEVVKVAADYLRSWFDAHPEETSFSFGMNDVTRHCHCPACIAMDRDSRAIERDDLADRTFAFINAVARELKKTHPNRYLGVLFYRHTYRPPAKVAKLEDRVFGYLACAASGWGGGKSGFAREALDREASKAWSRTSTLPVSRYEYMGLGTFTPVFYPHALDRQVKLDLSLGMEGQYTEFYTFLPNTIPMVRAFFRLQWKGSENMDRLLQEFYHKMFGASADIMAGYYAFLEQVWDTPHAGHNGAPLLLSRNVDEQCTVISPDETRKGIRLLDQALAAAKQDRVRKRIEIIKAALLFAKHGVDSYWYARDLRSTVIANPDQVKKALTAVAAYADQIEKRAEFWARAGTRRDILGDSIRALASHRYLMADSLAFERVDKTALLPFILNLFDWYGEHSPETLSKVRNVLDSIRLPESISLATRAYGKALGGANLLSNPGFEALGAARRQKDANDDWDYTGAPKGWNVWIRPRGKLGLPLSTVKIQPKAGRNGSRAAVFSAGTGGCLIASTAVKPGAKYFASVWLRSDKPEAAAKAHLTLIFKDTHGKLMNRDARKRVQYEKTFGIPTQAWQRLAVCATVPKAGETLCLMLGHEYAGAEILFDDALLLQAEKAPKVPGPSDLGVALADGLLKARAGKRLSGSRLRITDGRNEGTALAFAAGAREENSFLKIANVAKDYDFTKAMTIEAWIQVDSAYKKGTLEIIGNPFTDRGRGFRVYLNRGILHFISGSGGEWKNAKTWGAHGSEEHRITPGKWHHIAATYDGSVFKVFVDGEPAGKSAIGLKLTQGKPDLCIGSFRDGLVYGFMGKIADLEIHDNALSEDDIRHRAGGVR